MANKFGNFIRNHKVLYFPAHLCKSYVHSIKIILIQFKFFILYQVRFAGYKSRKFQAFRNLKNKYLGKRCFIVCTGPSLRAEDLDALKSEVCFSMNSIFKIFNDTQWRPTYYSIIDPSVYEMISKDEKFINMKNVLIPDILVKKYKKLTLKQYIQYPLNNNELYWHRITRAPIKFTDNADMMIYDVATVTYTLMQIAAYMGFKEIYLLGSDCDYSGNKQHFSDYGVKVDNAELVEDNFLLAYSAAKEYAQSHGIKIYNATRGGKLEIYERVDFDSLFKK